MKRSTGLISRRASQSGEEDIFTVLTFLITEVFSDSQTSKSDTSTSSWRLVHLTEHESNLGFAIQLNDFGLLHFVVQVVALAGALTHTSKDRVTTVSFGDVVLERSASISETKVQDTDNELLNENCLSNTSTSEKANLSATSVRRQQVDDLDASNQHFSSR